MPAGDELLAQLAHRGAAKAEDLGAVLRVLPSWAEEKAETYIHAIKQCIRPCLLFHQMCSTEEMRRVYNAVLELVAAKKAVFAAQIPKSPAAIVWLNCHLGPFLMRIRLPRTKAELSRYCAFRCATFKGAK